MEIVKAVWLYRNCPALYLQVAVNMLFEQRFGKQIFIAEQCVMLSVWNMSRHTELRFAG